MSEEVVLRRSAMHLLRSGQEVKAVAKAVKRSVAWVYKWQKRYAASGGEWQALVDRKRTPQRSPNRLPESLKQTIREVRSELEAEASEPGKLVYIGAHAIQGRLRKKKLNRIPSIASIERELRRAGLVRVRKPEVSEVVTYPHLQPNQARQLIQIDIVPRYLPGGDCVACFNAIDVVSRYPTGMQRVSKRSQDAVDFLLQVWSQLGIPTYTQVDNESCFSGGFTHPRVLGKVLRCALLVGTELVFSPVRHPESNGFVERFHQDYTGNVWNKTELLDLPAVQHHSQRFFVIYRQSPHHSALAGRSPQEIHLPGSFPDPLAHFHLPTPLPLTVGKVHFIRLVSQERKVMILNQLWDVPLATPNQGVWVSLSFTPAAATLRIYTAAPDAPTRTCLAEHPFPLSEPVLPVQSQFQPKTILETRLASLATLIQIGHALYHRFSTMF